MSKRMMLWLAMLVAACSSPEELPGPADRAGGEAGAQTTAAPGDEDTCAVGTLTNEGIECPAMQTLGGDVYTLVGDLQGAQAGDLICACGREVEQSTCMQGTTIELTRIGSPALCP